MEYKHNMVVHALIICLCGIATCLAQDNNEVGDIVIVTDFTPPAIYWATLGQRIQFKKIPVDGGRRNLTKPAAVDYDPVERRVYWTQWTPKWEEGSIFRCDLQGRFYQILVKGLEYANGLAIDSKARKMYFSSENMALERSNLDGTQRITIVRELATSAFSIYLDAIGKRIFWGDSTKKTIESVKLNGRDRQIHVRHQQGSPALPCDLFVDNKARRIYWLDFGFDRVASSNMTGGDFRVLYQYPLVDVDTHPNAIAVTEQNDIYWVDQNHKRLRKMPKNIRPGQNVMPRDVGNINFGWASGLHIHQGSAGNSVQSSIMLCLGIPLIFQLLLKF